MTEQGKDEPATKAGDGQETGHGLVPADLLEILCCPFEDCRKPLTEDVSERRLRCQGCGRRYPVDTHGTPTLLREEAEPPEAD